MRRAILYVTLFSLAALAPLATAATKSEQPAAATKSQPKTAVTTAGLETILQDDGLMLFRPAAEAQAAAARMKAIGVDRVRITASWSSLTRAPESDHRPENFDATDPAAYEQSRWRAIDNAVRAVRAAGMEVLIDIGFWAPHWATSDEPGPRARTNIDPQSYADFAVAVAKRYSGGFAPAEALAAPPPAPAEDETERQSILQPLIPFPPGNEPPPPPSARAAQAAAAPERLPAVDEFVLWNEPNHQALLLPQWQPDGTTPASPGVYRAMVRAAYPAVKAARSKVKVLIGNTSSTGGKRGSGAVPPLEFVRELACVDANLAPRTTPECANFTAVPGDGWAHHPYSQNERPSRVSNREKEPGDLRMADLPVLADTLNKLVDTGRLAPANRDIYLTEFGYETTHVQGRPDVSEIQQARWLTWAEYLADRVPTVRSFAQFLLRDQPPAAQRVSASNARAFGEFTTGLLVSSGNDKMAARTFVAGLFAQLQRKHKVLLFGRLRLGAGPKTVLLQRQPLQAPWKTVQRLQIDGRSAFQRTIAHEPGTLYRITYPGLDGTRQRGLPTKPVPAGR
ncbi:MAG TPA: hypothetical protein VMY78_11500 [Solirubrobacteraceae bacterium]|nr:hypothetical protein [Solirubrobacteraceae bacterium]